MAIREELFRDLDEPGPLRRNAKWVWAVCVFVSTALLTFLSFPPVSAAEFAYVFAVPAIVWAYRRPSLKWYAWTLFAAQAVAWFALLFWLREVSWLGLALLAPFVGAWVGLWYLAVWWAMPRFLVRSTTFRVAGILGLAGLWVLIEWSRTWFLTGFPWLPLAASQWQRTLVLQIISYTGAYGLSFLLIAFNVGFAAYAHRLFFERHAGLRKRCPEFMAALMIVMFMAFLPFREVFGQQRATLGRIAVVQPNIPQEIKWNPARAASIQQVLVETTAKAAQTRPDLILWPESVMPFQVNRHEPARLWVEQISRNAKAPILFGTDLVEGEGDAEVWYNGAAVVDPKDGLQARTYGKRHLVPFGEYVPWRPILGWLQKVVPVGADDFTPGKFMGPLVIATQKDPLVVAPLICYEDLFPDLVRDDAQSGASLLVVLTNGAWFGEGAASYQHAAHSVLRAVETRLPVVRCGNSGWSGWIDEYGNIRDTIQTKGGSIYFRSQKTFTVTRDVRWDKRPSIYTTYGNWIVWASAGLVLVGWMALTLIRGTEVTEDRYAPLPPSEDGQAS